MKGLGVIDQKELKNAMSFLYDSYKETYTEKVQREIAESVNRWSWFLGPKVFGKDVWPIPAEQWATMACLLDNFMEYNPQKRDLFEQTTLSTVSLPVKYALPIIREVFPTLIMNKICSIQPMPPSSGGTMQVFWMKFYREDESPEVQVTTNDSDYATRSENEVPKRLRMKVTNTSVTATKDILNATWSTEVMQDARGALGIDVEQELVRAMSEEILRELESRILNAILVGATAGNVPWAWTMGGTYTNQKDWYQTLGDAVIDAERLVRANRHRRCNYIIAGLRVESYLRKMSQWNTTQKSADASGPLQTGVELMGSLNGMWDVYSTPYINQDRAIISYYPESMLHAGYIWAPYVPLMPMELQYSEMMEYDHATLPGALVNTDKWNRNVLTRNAVYYAEPNMFATLSISA